MSNLDLGREAISKEDIQAKFEDLKHSLDGTAEAARTPALAGGMLFFAVLVALAFLLGRRRGRAGRTVVEVRRV
ncbi:MAG: hypothetical protein OXH23_09165 [bacterium]|nr:hypothetical protein [bacterium]MYH72962.1 hypothetical protein [Acidimicrobiia bacterium]